MDPLSARGSDNIFYHEVTMDVFYVFSVYGLLMEDVSSSQVVV